MTVSHVEVLVEEPSMEHALRALLPGILGEITFRIYAHQGKSGLLKCLPDRLRGYASWLPDDARILVVVDRDNDECRDLKATLERMAADAGLATRSARAQRKYRVINRLAIEELESWYFGDWKAVRKAYPRVSETVPAGAKYRHPDAIAGGTWEAFERVMQRAGFFKGGLRKIEAARTIAPRMDPHTNRSPSFRCLRDALRDLSAV